MGIAGLNSNSKKRTGSRRFRASKGVIADINMTPFIDVMLVLLIIFMVSAPLLTVGVPANLPQTVSTTLPSEVKPITVTLTRNGDIYIQEFQVAEENLIQAIKNHASTSGTDNPRILIRGDKDLNYGRMMQIIALISNSGYGKLGFVTSPENEAN